MKRFFCTFCLFVFLFSTATAAYQVEENISYLSANDKDAYRQEQCKLDIYRPAGKEGLPVLIWFHGGGLEVGSKRDIPQGLKGKDLVLVSVGYRLSPKSKNPAYIEDAAEAVAWVFKNIGKYGGSAEKIFVSGHSAGGYLTLMVGLDKQYLAKHGVDADSVKGLIPVSGQTNTHYTIRKERGLPLNIPIVDNYAPLHCVRKGVPPTLLITGDRKLEMTARYEENLHLEAVMKSFYNPVQLFELQGFDHGSVLLPSEELMLGFIKKQLSAN